MPGTLLSALDLGVNKIKSSLYIFKRIQTINKDIYIFVYYIYVVKCHVVIGIMNKCNKCERDGGGQERFI